MSTSKGDPTDLVTSADLAVDSFVRSYLDEYDPSSSILSEESVTTRPNSTRRWILDPLDGTSNFVRQRGNWATSVALEEGDEVVIGGVADPSLKRTYLAIKEEGSWLIADSGVRRMRASMKSDLRDAIGCTGFSNARTDRLTQQLELGRLAPNFLDIRQYGSAALDLCNVASGALDFYYEKGTSIWDIAAGRLIATEAGASVSNVNEILICSNSSLHSELKVLLA